MSMNFEQICQLKKGYRVFENAGQKSLPFVLLTDPVIEGETVTFVGQFEDGAWDFLLTKGFDQYGHKLSFEPAYESVA